MNITPSAAPNVCGPFAVVGGTGFIGREVSRVLRARGHTVRLIARHAPEKLEAGEEFVAADTSLPDTLVDALKGCDGVVHLVAILNNRKYSFDEVIHQGARRVALAAKDAGVSHMVYVSALGADVNSASGYARAKGMAENEVRAVFPEAMILRPSLVIGHGGGFTKQIDLLTRFAPFMVLPGYGRTRFQPVPLTELAEVVAEACIDRTHGVRDVAGPVVVTFRQLVVEELSRLKRRRILIPMPWSLTGLVAQVMTMVDNLTGHRLIPDWLMVTPDQVVLLRVDNVAGDYRF